MVTPDNTKILLFLICNILLGSCSRNTTSASQASATNGSSNGGGTPWKHYDNSSAYSSDNKSLYDLVSSQSDRPVIEDLFLDMRNGNPAFRLGVWELQGFSVDKASNPGVLEVMCRTILENG